MAGFFPAAEVTRKPPPSVLPKCGSCGLYLTCKSPKLPVAGRGKLGVLIVTDAPEDDSSPGYQSGHGGQELRRTLRSIDVDLDEDCWTTSALICRPPEGRKPTGEEVDYCRPNLTAAIRELKPKVVIPMGWAAAKAVIAPFWRSDIGSVSEWVGWRIPLQKPNLWITPTHPPTQVAQALSSNEKTAPVLKLWFRRHLQSAIELCGSRPWDVVPDFASRVRVEYDPSAVRRWIREVVFARGGMTSFDYETNMLKPDADNGEIVSCAICWQGKESLAFPMVGDAVAALVDYLISDIPKIGANNKFEDRWTLAKLGVRVNRWAWDDMLSAHHLDQRAGITSVKQQAFVRLGMEPWDLAMRPYLEGDGGYGENTIRKADLGSLLRYNGMDPLMEYYVGVLQRAEMLQQDSEAIRRAI